MEWSDIHYSRGLYPSDGDIDESKARAYATEINCEVDRLIFSGHDKARRHQKCHARALRQDCRSCKAALEPRVPVTELDVPSVRSLACRAIAENDSELLQEVILSGKIDLNETVDGHRNWNCLMLACYTGRKDLVHLLLENGVDVNIQDTCGSTPLIIAAREEFRDIVVELIRHGADTEQRDRLGYTAMLIATRFGNADALEALLEKGADIDASLPNGDTALHIAAATGEAAVACLLWKYGCRRDAENIQGQTPLQIAKSKRQHGTERIILASLGQFGEFGEHRGGIYHKEIIHDHGRGYGRWYKEPMSSHLRAEEYF